MGYRWTRKIPISSIVILPRSRLCHRGVRYFQSSEFCFVFVFSFSFAMLTDSLVLNKQDTFDAVKDYWMNELTTQCSDYGGLLVSDF